MNSIAELWKADIFDTVTNDLVALTSLIGLGIGLICFLINLAYNYIRTGAGNLFGQDEPFPDMMDISRCIVIFFALSVYSGVAKTITGTLEAINDSTAQTQASFTTWQNAFTHYKEEEAKQIDGQAALQHEIDNSTTFASAASHEQAKVQESNTNEPTDDNDWKSEIKGIFGLLNPINMGTAATHGLLWALGGIIGMIVQGYAVICMKLLVILGPLTFGFSMLPVFRKQISVWFGTLCSLGISLTVINVLNILMAQVMDEIFQQNLFQSLFNASKTLALDIVMVVAYCSVFWLSSKIVGHRDAGQILSKTASLVTSTAAIIAGGGALAAGRTSAGGVSKAASAGKSVIKGG